MIRKSPPIVGADDDFFPWTKYLHGDAFTPENPATTKTTSSGASGASGTSSTGLGAALDLLADAAKKVFGSGTPDAKTTTTTTTTKNPAKNPNPAALVPPPEPISGPTLYGDTGSSKTGLFVGLGLAAVGAWIWFRK